MRKTHFLEEKKMVLETERYPGGYHQNSYSAYQGPKGSYSNFQDVTQQTSPYSGYGQGSTYQSTHASQQQSGWSTSGGYPGNGGTQYPGSGYPGNGGSQYPGSGIGGSLKPTNGGYGSSPYGYGSPHGQSHGSPHGGHGGPQSHGYGGPQGYGNSHGYGSGAPNQFNKPTHGLDGYGNGSPYGHGPNGVNNGYQKPTWDVKLLEDDDDE